MSDRQVVVIGAGQVAAGEELRRAAVAAVVLDRADAVGASWRARYDCLRLNTSRITSKVTGRRYPHGTGLFPTRDEMVKYLEGHAAHSGVEVRLRTEVERIDRGEDGWVLRTSGGDVAAEHVIVATGFEHTPVIPEWVGRERFKGRLLHAHEYRNAEPFRGQEVLVVGPGCSGMEIAYDLAEGGARPVRLAVRTQPNIVLRQSHGIPSDVPAQLFIRLPPRIADAPMKLVRRLDIGDLSKYGLVPPNEGLFTRLRREGKSPAVVDKEMVEAIKDGRIEIVAGVKTLDETGVRLSDGNRIEPAAIIAATGYRRGLEPLVGHLDVLDEHGIPRIHRGREAAPGLRFIGYLPVPGQMREVSVEAKRAAKEIARETQRTRPAGEASPAAAGG